MKNKEAKEKKPNIKKLIIEQCDKDKNIILMDIGEDSAFIIKKKHETVRRELCPGTMNPVEIFEDVTFFHFFVVRWTNKKILKNSLIRNLEEKEFPIYHVETEYDILKALKDA